MQIYGGINYNNSKSETAKCCRVLKEENHLFDGVSISLDSEQWIGKRPNKSSITVVKNENILKLNNAHDCGKGTDEVHLIKIGG